MIKSIPIQSAVNVITSSYVATASSNKTSNAPLPPPLPPLPSTILSPLSNQQSQLSPPIANPVLIIHQNNSVCTNVVPTQFHNNNNNNHHYHSTTNNLIIDDLNLTSNETLQINTTTNLSEQFDQMNEIKYMKGYVNVLKERFTRKSLGNDSSTFDLTMMGSSSSALTNGSLQQQQQSPANKTNNSSSSISNSGAVRMTNGDYQRRKMQVGGAQNSVYRNSNTSSSNVINLDDKRRRSTSSYATSSNSYSISSANYTQYNKTNNSNNNCNSVSSQFNDTKKLFASTEDLTAATSSSTKSNKNRFSLNANVNINSSNLALNTNTYLSNYQNSSNFQNGLKPLFYNQPLVSKLINSQQQQQQQPQYQRNPDLNGHYHYINHQLTRPMRNSSNSVEHLIEQPQNQQLASSNLSNSSSFTSTPSIFNHSDVASTPTTQQPPSSSSILATHQIDVIKCTYTNEINKDELPRPNFVSSVKNLFEKQIHVSTENRLSENLNITNSNINSNINVKSYHAPIINNINNNSSISNTTPNINTKLNNRSINNEPIIESNLCMPVSPSSSSSSSSSSTSSPSSATSSATSTANSSSDSLLLPSYKSDNLVDILKQNGTLVYDHTEISMVPNNTERNSNFIENVVNNQTKPSIQTKKSPTTQTPISAKASTKKVNAPKATPSNNDSINEMSMTDANLTNRVLSFKERKEIFNNQQQISTTTTSQSISNPNVNKRIKIETTTNSTALQHDKENQEFNTSTTINDSFTKDECDNNIANVLQSNTKKSNAGTLINSKKNHSNQNSTINEDLTNGNACIDQNNNNEDESNTNKDEELIDQMLMMSANNILNSAQELQVQKAKLKSKSSVKMKTFYGGEVINDVNTLNLATGPVKSKNTISKTDNLTPPTALSITSSEVVCYEFIGAGVKLEKSILVSASTTTSNVNNINNNNNNINSNKQRKKKVDANGVNLRVNFTDIAETYEYPSYEFMLKELGIDPDTDPDYQMTSNNEQANSSLSSLYSGSDVSSTVSFTNFLPGRIDFDDNLNGNSNDDGADADVEDSSDYISATSTNTNNSLANNNINGKNAKIFNGNGDVANTTNFNKLSSFTNFKPSWHNMNYELGHLDKFESNINKSSTNQSSKNGKTTYESNNQKKNNTKKNNNNHLQNGTSSTDSITHDILPSNDDEVKRWSCEMDSNILF